jgi:hypothetical protein
MNVESALKQLTDHIAKHSGNKYQNSIIDTENSLKETRFTVLTAEKYMARYLATSGEKQANPEDLLKACHFLLFEIQSKIDSQPPTK